MKKILEQKIDWGNHKPKANFWNAKMLKGEISAMDYLV